jgi:hypothetical protein
VAAWIKPKFGKLMITGSVGRLCSIGEIKMSQKDSVIHKHSPTLINIRDIIARIHDNHCAFGPGGLPDIELAALRDSIRRLNEVVISLNTEE